jgi:PKD repeat protein
MFSLTAGDPPQSFPYCPDSNAPTHYELLAASCPGAGALLAAFSATPARPANARPVAFTDQSTGGATAWAWTFGDGTGSSERNPSHTYASPGVYPVRLLVTGAGAASSASSSLRIGPLWGHGGPGPRRALHGVPVTGTPHPAAPR